MAVSRSFFPWMYERNWWDTADYASSIFGSGLLDSNSYPPIFGRGSILRPRPRAAVQSSGELEVKNEKDKFQIMLNVGHFKPEEIEVKVVDRFVVIHGKHEERIDDHGFVQREFTRRYMLPEGTESETVKSSLSVNGILTIEAPKKAVEALSSNERVIPITMSAIASPKKTSD